MARRLARPASTGASIDPKERAVAVAEYWTRHNVTSHRRFRDAEESLAYLAWRNNQYYGYAERMPVEGQDGKVVLDFGCGPGNDLVGFGVRSRPRRLIGCDVSGTSLDEARRRLALHGIAAELVHLAADATRLPLEDASVDHVHSSGCLHHTVDPHAFLVEFRRVLRPGGTARISVHNYDSLWLHLHVAYHKLLVERRYGGLDIRAAFARTTDGEECPISGVYRPGEFMDLAETTGFRCSYTGAAVSAWEASLFPTRFRAVMDERLREESRAFLLGLTVDERGLPRHAGQLAGVVGCFLLHKDSESGSTSRRRPSE